MTKRKDIPLTPRANRLFVRRSEWATEGVRMGYINLTMHRKIMCLASTLAAEETRRWWMPRPDQPWRYDRKEERRPVRIAVSPENGGHK